MPDWRFKIVPKQFLVRKYEGREKIFIIAIKQINYPSVNLIRSVQILLEKKINITKGYQRIILKKERNILGRKTQHHKDVITP